MELCQHKNQWDKNDILYFIRVPAPRYWLIFLSQLRSFFSHFPTVIIQYSFDLVNFIEWKNQIFQQKLWNLSLKVWKSNSWVIFKVKFLKSIWIFHWSKILLQRYVFLAIFPFDLTNTTSTVWKSGLYLRKRIEIWELLMSHFSSSAKNAYHEWFIKQLSPTKSIFIITKLGSVNLWTNVWQSSPGKLNFLFKIPNIFKIVYF